MSENSDPGQLLEPSSTEESNAIQNDVAGSVHEVNDFVTRNGTVLI